MVAGNVTTVRSQAAHLSYSEAGRIAERVLAAQPRRTVLIDVQQASTATTPALARLVLLRRRLLATGRDLRIVGLRDRAEGLYDISRMADILPRGPAAAMSA